MAKNISIYFVLVIFGVLDISSGTANAQNVLDIQIKALSAITKAAEDICATVALEGSSQDLNLSGAVKAKLDGVIAKVVDLGVEGAGQYTSNQFKNVLQKDLSSTLKATADCKQNVLKMLQEKMIPTNSPTTTGTPGRIKYQPKEDPTFPIRMRPMVIRDDNGQEKKLTVLFQYPAKDAQGQFVPPAHDIQVYAYQTTTAGRKDVSFETIHGTWNPGDQVMIKVSVPSAYFDDANGWNLHYCIGDVIPPQGRCMISPNLLTGTQVN
jgi:hypothetical protein